VIFDADLSAYDAALSEGWPVHRKRTEKKMDAPTLEPFSAFLLRTPEWRTRQHRIAA
jgi:hypothetical protein